MKALVLGGNGFIGSHIVDLLLEQGNDVRVFDRSPELFRPPLRTVDYHVGAFGDAGALERSLDDRDVVFHCISTMVPASSNRDPVKDVQENLVASVQLLELMVTCRVPRIVFLSSGGTVYGIPSTLPIPETHALHPLCSYGIVKLAIEHYIRLFNQLHGMHYVILRAANPYGERQGHHGIQGAVGTFLMNIERNEAIELWGDGSIVRDFIYVRDLAGLAVLAASLPVQGIYNAGSGTGRSLREVLDVAAELAGRQPNIMYLRQRSFDIPEVVLDISRTTTAFPWQPAVGLREGMSRTLEWIRQVIRQKGERPATG